MNPLFLWLIILQGPDINSWAKGRLVGGIAGADAGRMPAQPVVVGRQTHKERIFGDTTFARLAAVVIPEGGIMPDVVVKESWDGTVETANAAPVIGNNVVFYQCEGRVAEHSKTGAVIADGVIADYRRRILTAYADCAEVRAVVATGDNVELDDRSGSVKTDDSGSITDDAVSPYQWRGPLTSYGAIHRAGIADREPAEHALVGANDHIALFGTINYG